MGWLGYNNRAIWNLVEFRGMTTQLEALANRLEPDAVLLFDDDFEDGDASDGDPVTWHPVSFATGDFDVVDGNYVLTNPEREEEDG